MAVEVPMPRLSDTMEQGTVARWVKQEGDRVVAGDVIAEIDTDKATMELTAYEDGVLLKILVGEGESADLGTPIALIGAEDEEVPETAARGNGPAQTAPQEDQPGDAGAPEAGGGEPAPSEPGEPPAPEARSAVGDGLRASPIARRMSVAVAARSRRRARPRSRKRRTDAYRATSSAGRSSVGVGRGSTA